jgi:hypothetical protein
LLEQGRMREKAAFVLVIGLVIGAAAGLSACSAPDPDAIHFAPRYFDSGGTTTDTGLGALDAAGRPAADGALSPADGGAPSGDAAPGDAAADAVEAAAPTNAFTGAAPYASQPVGTSAQQEHQNRGVGTVPTGNDCLSCHNGGVATQFGFAGTIYTSALAVAGAADVEVRVVDGAGTLYGGAHSDANGDFWLVDNAAFPPGTGYAGARNSTTTMLMPSNPPKGACNSSGCHDANQRLHLP